MENFYSYILTRKFIEKYNSNCWCISQRKTRVDLSKLSNKNVKYEVVEQNFFVEELGGLNKFTVLNVYMRNMQVTYCFEKGAELEKAIGIIEKFSPSCAENFLRSS